MAVTERAVLELLLQAAQFDSELKDSQSKFLRSVERMEKAARQIDFDPASKEARELRAEVQRTGKEFVETADRQRKAMSGTAKATDKAEQETKQLRREVGKLNKEGTKGGKRFASQLGVIRTAALQLSTVFGGLSIAFLARGVFQQLASFESRMSGVRAVTQATGQEMAAMEQQAKQLGATTIFSASQAAEGMEFLGRAGFETREILEAMPGLLNLAAAGALDLGRAADIASNIVTGFGLEAKETGRVADVLAAAAANANTNVEQMGEAMKFVAPVAAGLAVSVEETAAAVGILSNAGIQAQMAGTSLRNVLGRLTGAVGAAGGVFEDLGVDIQKLNPQTNSLTDILDTLADAGVDATKALEAMQQRGGPALQVLINQRAELAELTETLNGAKDAAADMAAVMRDNLSGDLRELQSVIESTTLQVGDRGLAGALRSATQGMTGMVRESGPVIDTISGVGKLINASLDVFIARMQKAAAQVGLFVFEALSNLPKVGKAYEDLADNQRDLIADIESRLPDATQRMAEAMDLLTSSVDQGVSEASASVAQLGNSLVKAASTAEEQGNLTGAVLEELARKSEKFLNSLALLPEDSREKFAGMREEAERLVAAFEAASEDGEADPRPTIKGAGEEADEAKGKVGGLADEMERLAGAQGRVGGSDASIQADEEAAKSAEELGRRREQLSKQIDKLQSKELKSAEELNTLFELQDELSGVERERNNILSEQADELEIVGDATGLLDDHLRDVIKSQRDAADAGSSFLDSLDPAAVDAMNDQVASTEEGFSGLGEKTGLAKDQLIQYTEEGASPAAEQTERAVDALKSGQDEFNAIAAAGAEAGKEIAAGAEQAAEAGEKLEEQAKSESELLEERLNLLKSYNSELQRTVALTGQVAEACREWHECMAG